jgi:tetratricopeptide (TPR) repeat protein
VAGWSCEAGVEKARELTRQGALVRARLVYLWFLSHCNSSPALPDAMLEAGSLFGHLLHRPDEARRVYAEFLRRFPTHGEAGNATYHLARLEIDAGDYATAVAHLTALAQRYPNSWHDESAKFLAAKAAEMLAADRHRRRTVIGQLAELVPNNLVSLLALLTAIGPSMIQTMSKARGASFADRPRVRWVMPSLIVGLTLLNYLINNVDSARRNRILMDKLDRLAAVGVQSRESQ